VTTGVGATLSECHHTRHSTWPDDAQLGDPHLAADGPNEVHKCTIARHELGRR